MNIYLESSLCIFLVVSVYLPIWDLFFNLIDDPFEEEDILAPREYTVLLEIPCNSKAKRVDMTRVE